MKLLMENWRKFLTESKEIKVFSFHHAYKTLGFEDDKNPCKEGCTPQDIDESSDEFIIAKKNFRNLALQLHPDKTKSDLPAIRFNEVREAYETLVSASKGIDVKFGNPNEVNENWSDELKAYAEYYAGRQPAQQSAQSYSGGMPDDILSRWAKAAAAQKARDDAAAKRGQEELRAYMAANPEAGTEPPPPTPIPKSEEDEDFAKLMAKLKYAGRSGGRR